MAKVIRKFMTHTDGNLISISYRDLGQGWNTGWSPWDDERIQEELKNLTAEQVMFLLNNPGSYLKIVDGKEIIKEKDMVICR